MIEIQVRNQCMQLLPQRAVFWVEKKILIVADIHLGKASTMQHAGIGIPEGAMETDLQNLKSLIASTGAEKCIVVGDLVHAKAGLSERVRQKFEDWLSSSSCPVELVIGNHDRFLLKQLPDNWKLSVHQDHLIIEPFCFTHIPKPVGPHFVWSGHIHPQYLLRSHNDQMTLRCFHLNDNQGILPAFSDFVGGAYVKKGPNDKVFVIADTHVIPL